MLLVLSEISKDQRPKVEDLVAQEIIWRNDGLWCTECNKGPVLHCDVMAEHIESRLHTKNVHPLASSHAQLQKVQLPAPLGAGAPIEVPPVWTDRGIRAGDSGDRLPTVSEVFCALCDMGPFQSLEAARAHMQGRKHLKKKAARTPVHLTPELVAACIAACTTSGQRARYFPDG